MGVLSHLLLIKVLWALVYVMFGVTLGWALRDSFAKRDKDGD